jgi:shikimate kinase
MYSGKSTIGRLLARRLGWEFIDFDETIEQSQNRRISEIFRESGEGFFRDLEAGLTKQIEGRSAVVLAPGGGWVTQPGLVTRLRDSSLFVWLRVRPETAYGRHLRRADRVRPLLDVADPLETVRSLLAARSPLYEQADEVVDTDGREPEDVADEIADLIRRRRSPGVLTSG